MGVQERPQFSVINRTSHGERRNQGCGSLSTADEALSDTGVVLLGEGVVRLAIDSARRRLDDAERARVAGVGGREASKCCRAVRYDGRCREHVPQRTLVAPSPCDGADAEDIEEGESPSPQSCWARGPTQPLTTLISGSSLGRSSIFDSGGEVFTTTGIGLMRGIASFPCRR